MSYDSSNHFACTMTSHVGVANHVDSGYVASVDFTFVIHHMNYNFECYAQDPMSSMYTLSFNHASNIQHAYVYPYSLTLNSQYVVPPQNMSMYDKIDYDDANYLVTIC